MYKNTGIAFYSELCVYLTNNKIKGVKVTFENNITVIKPSIFTSMFFVDFFPIVFCLVLLRRETWLIFSLLAGFGFIRVIMDIDARNNILIDFDTKEITISSKNIFLRPIFPKKIVIGFKEVRRISTTRSSHPFLFARYKLLLELKTGERVVLFDFDDDKKADGAAQIFKSFI